MSIPSNNTSPACHSPSYQYPEQTIDLELFINATHQREDARTTITMMGGDPIAFAEHCFINYLCQHEQDSER